jgi:ComB9 competence protein
MAEAQNIVPEGLTPSLIKKQSVKSENTPYQSSKNLAEIPTEFSSDMAITQEMKGNYPPMDRPTSLPLGTLQKGWEKPHPSSGQTAPGIVHYMWHPDFVMSVRTRDFMVTTIILPPWENINEYYLGDSVVFETKKVKANIAVVRSKNSGADSNLTIIGSSGNIYNFYIRSEGWNSERLTDIAIYVDSQSLDNFEINKENNSQNLSPRLTKDINSDPSSLSGLPDYLRSIIVHPEDIRFDIKIYARNESDTDIAPERVFEDGLFTYFDFGDRSDRIARPVVHQLIDGVDSIVNTRTAGSKGNVLIAEAIGDFTLRNGNRILCVRKISKSPPPPSVLIDPAYFSSEIRQRRQ